MRLKKEDISLFFTMELFMLPIALLNYPVVSVLWYSALFFAIGFFVIRKRIFHTIRTNKVKWLLVLYMGIQSICTYMNSGPWIKNILSLVVVFMLCVIFEETLDKNMYRGLTVFKYVLVLNILIENLLYLICDCSILSTIQCGYVYYIVWATISVHLSKEKRRTNIEVILVSIFIILVTIIKPQMDDGKKNYEWTFYTIAIMFIMVCMFDKVFCTLRKIINGSTVFILIILLNLIFVIFSVQDRISIVRFIIEDVMHKDIGLTGRSGIWDFAKRLILIKPTIGYGTGLTTLGNDGKWYDFMKIYGPHNQFLYILLAGGVVTLVPYLILLLYVFQKLEKSKTKEWSYVYSLGLLAMYLELMVTYRSYATCMPLFAMFVIIELLGRRNEIFGL